MIAPMPEEFQERAHHAELSNDCLESLAGIFNGKAEMPDAKYYPLAEQGSWKYEETLRLIEEKKNWLFMAKNIRGCKKRHRR